MKMKNFILSLAFVGSTFATSAASGAILWAGGEDIDFPYGVAPCVQTTASHFRANYARHALYSCQSHDIAISAPFSAGAVTSAWISARVYLQYTGSLQNIRFLGVGKTGTANSLWVGNNTTQGKLTLWKYNGTTWSSLASEAGTSFPAYALTKIDMEIISFGATATVRIYTNGATLPVITYTGDVTSGSANFDDVRIAGASFSSGAVQQYSVSEVIVADTDTRNLSLITLAPNAAGTTNQWTGAHTDINEATNSDASVVSTATTGQVFQCNLTDLPSGSFSVQGIRVAARSTKSGSGAMSLSPGIFTNSSANVPAATALSGAWEPVQSLYQSTNPVTSSPWTSSDINALQLNLQSAP